jgi:hypothetical protein
VVENGRDGRHQITSVADLEEFRDQEGGGAEPAATGWRRAADRSKPPAAFFS